MSNQILVIGDVTPEQITQISSEYETGSEELAVTMTSFKEFFLDDSDLVDKYYPGYYLRSMENEEVPLPLPDTNRLVIKHVNSFGGPFAIVVLDEYSWIYGKDRGYTTWGTLMPPRLWVAYRDGSTCPVDVPDRP